MFWYTTYYLGPRPMQPKTAAGTRIDGATAGRISNRCRLLVVFKTVDAPCGSALNDCPDCAQGSRASAAYPDLERVPYSV